MSARTRARLAAASFGPEWRPLGGMAGWLVETGPHRTRERFSARLRAARRDLAAAEARWQARGVCGTYWGSHGCDLPADHPETVHVCGPDDPEGACSRAWVDPAGQAWVAYNDDPDNDALPTVLFGPATEGAPA